MTRKDQENVIGIDRGERYVGMAYVQIATGMVFPIGHVLNAKDLYHQVVTLVHQYHGQALVVGKPQQESFVTKEIDAFVARLRGMLPDEFPIEFVGEDFSSVQAGDKLGGFDKVAGEDTVAAMVILERWLDIETN